MATFHEFRSALLGSAAYPASAHHRKCWLIHVLNITIVHASSTCTSNFRAEGGQAVLALQQTFPVRNMSVAKCVAAINSPSPTKAPRAGRAKCHSKWGMEKGYAVMAHANESNLVMGNLANTSAQVSEKKHLSIKSDATRTKNKTNWELQVLSNSRAGTMLWSNHGSRRMPTMTRMIQRHCGYPSASHEHAPRSVTPCTVLLCGTPCSKSSASILNVCAGWQCKPCNRTPGPN